MDALVSRCCRSSMVITMNMTDDVQYLYVAQWWKSDCRALDVCVCVCVCALLFTWPPGLFWHSVSPSPGEEKPKDIFIRVQNLQRNWSTNLFLWLQSPILKKHTLQTFHFNYCSWLKHTLQKNRIKKNLIHELGRACVSSTRQNKHLSTCLFNYASAFSWC